MFITRSQHRRDSLGVSRDVSNVDDEGLGIVIIQTTRFDPTQMRGRFVYWLELAVNQMAKQARQEIQDAGFDVEEAESERVYYKNRTIKAIPFNEMSAKIRSIVASWSSEVALPKTPSTVKTYGMMAGKLALSYVMPWVGLALTISTFVFKKKERMAIPWHSIYSQALPFAQTMTVNEETSRIIGELQQTQQIRVKAIEKGSQEAAVFKLPEGVIGIRRGALVMALKGQAVEVRK